MEAKVRRGGIVIPNGAKEPASGLRAEDCPVVWDRTHDIRLGLCGYEIILSCNEGRAFAGLIIEAVRRAEKRQREAAKATSPSASIGGS